MMANAFKQQQLYSKFSGSMAHAIFRKKTEPISIKDLLTGITQLHFCFTSLVKKKINQPFFFFFFFNAVSELNNV